MRGPYRVGDIVSYCRRPRTGETRIQWSVGSRIVGFEVDGNHPQKEPSTAWVICDGLSVCVATDKIRPCTAAELLAFQYMKDATQNPKFASHVQQSFIDERDHVPSPSPRKKKARSATAASEGHIAPAAEK